MLNRDTPEDINEDKPSLLKRAGRFTWRRIVPTSLAVGSITGTAGRQLYAQNKFIKYATGQDEHPATLPAAIIAICITVIMKLIRIPSLYHQFSGKRHDEKKGPNLGLLGKSIYYPLLVIGYISVSFIALASYLGTITTSEFIAKLKGEKSDDADWKIATVQSTAGYFAVSAALNNLSLPQKSYKYNMQQLAHSIEHWDFNWNTKNALLAIAICTPGAVSAMFSGYFSTHGSLGKIPYVGIDDETKKYISAFSTITAFITVLGKNVPAIYKALQYGHRHARFQKTHAMDKPITVTNYTVGIGDSGMSAIKDFTAVVTTTHDVFDVNPYNPYLMAGGILAGTSTAVMTAFFSTHENFQRVRERVLRDLGYLPYNALPTIVETSPEVSPQVSPRRSRSEVEDASDRPDASPPIAIPKQTTDSVVIDVPTSIEEVATRAWQV